MCSVDVERVKLVSVSLPSLLRIEREGRERAEARRFLPSLAGPDLPCHHTRIAADVVLSSTTTVTNLSKASFLDLIRAGTTSANPLVKA